MTTARHQPHALLTISEVAELLHLSDDTVRRQIKEGDLPAVRLGTTPKGRARYRIAQDVVMRLLNGQAVLPPPSASERLQAVFADLSDEQQEALIAQAVQWARQDQPAPPAAKNSPEPSREEVERRFAASRVVLAERSSSSSGG